MRIKDMKMQFSPLRSASTLRAALLASALLTGSLATVWAAEAPAVEKPVLPPVVSVLAAAKAELVDAVLVTGTLVAREEVLVGPEIEGMRIVELMADEGDRVVKGQVLARLARETLDAQLAQSLAAQVRSDAAIAQVKSQIGQWEAVVAQKTSAFARAQSLRRDGVTTDASLENATADVRTSQAQLNATRDGLRVAEADIASILAMRQELLVRISRTEVRAPAGGIVSRRSARLGAVATGAGEAMFRIISGADIELEAEVPELRLAKMRPGQPASVTIADVVSVTGKVRLVSPEVDKASRLGKVRISVEKNDSLRIGAFARGEVEVARRMAVALPLSAVLYDAKGAYVQSVRDGVVFAVSVKIGLTANGQVEIISGVFEDDTIIAKAGSFLHDGDKVRTVFQAPKAATIWPAQVTQAVPTPAQGQ